MPSHLDFIFWSIFHRFLPPTSIPWTLKIIVFPQEKQGFFKKSLFEVGIDFWSILVPTCFHFASKNPPKSFQKSIPRCIVFLIDFCIVFSSILNENSSHFDSQIRPRASKNRSRGSLRASKTPQPPKDLPRASPDLPKTLPRAISDHFFIQKRASEPQFSSQEVPVSKIDSPKSTFGGRRNGACHIK